MSYKFLTGYSIPLLPKPPSVPAALLNDYEVEPDSPMEIPAANAQINSQPSINAQPSAPRPPKRKFDGGIASAKSIIQVEATSDTKMAMFQGRDVSYPDELNMLIHPLHCELCGMHMNSAQSAKDHYESKTHDRNISIWLTKNYTTKGISPPAVKRFVRNGPAGPNAFHCELCDLKLTSLTHANQHYSGRKHRLVANKISQPSGAGYYNKEGKWVRTGSKYVPPAAAGRIGEQFKAQSQSEAGAADTTTPTESEKTVGVTVTIEAAKATAVPASTLATALYCQVCKVSVTSHSQMMMHLNGSKHQKKLKQCGVEQLTAENVNMQMEESMVAPSCNSILEAINEKVNPAEDYSMYRTPTGSYYCQTCNMMMCHVKALQQHLTGRKHIKQFLDEKEQTKEGNKVPKEGKK